MFNKEELEILRSARRRTGMSFVPVADVIVDQGSAARVVDVLFVRDSDESPLVGMELTQHYGALCGAKIEEGVPLCGLTPGHNGSHHPMGEVE